EVDPLCAVALPGHRGVQRGAVLGFAARLPLHEAHCTAVDNVYRREKYQHGGQPSAPIQLASNSAPASPLFSGWNWVADSGPSSTAARNGTWWVAHVSSASGLPSHCCAAYECTK